MVPPGSDASQLETGASFHGVQRRRPINDIKYDCRWSEKSRSFDAYCRTDLVTMHPHEIYEEFPQSCRVWHDARLVFIANKLIMTAGPVPGHPHHTVLIDEFYEQYQRIKDQLPTAYPAPEVLVRMVSRQADTKRGIFISKQRNEE